MSAFDDNPFADPFAEPSIQQATRGSAQNGLEEYDPFGGQSAGTTTTAQGVASPPTYVQPTVSGGGVQTAGRLGASYDFAPFAPLAMDRAQSWDQNPLECRARDV